MKLSAKERNMFVLFMTENSCCWICGWQRGKKNPVSKEIWSAPLSLENHHIVGGSGRKHVRQNIARLCSICHRVFHGDIIRITKEFVLPNITIANILYAKRSMDEKWYDVSVLNKLAIGIMPEPVRPDSYYDNNQRW